ncbi:Auxin-induced protein 15A [Linum perenne]
MEGGRKVLVKYRRRRSHIPKDVPRGHMAVYVGEDWKRYVIKVAFINHPLFRTLLDQLLEHDHDHAACSSSPLHIPCTHSIFETVLNCAKRDSCSFWRCFL